MENTIDILNIFKQKFINKEFRFIGNNVQESSTLEIQGATFEAEKPWIVREPNYEYAEKELKWYKSMSLNVNDIPGDKVPKMWQQCADKDGFINSNYGWCIWSKENGEQYKNCLNKLLEDNHTREACMIYNRPSMQTEYNKNGMHDFMCTYSTQVFINDINPTHKNVSYHVFQRSQDAVFGFNNDILWHMHVLNNIIADLSKHYPDISFGYSPIICHVGSLHIYERHYKFLQ